MTTDADGWGPWQLAERPPALVHAEEGYHIDLLQCKTAAGVLDWIIQIAGKGWGTDECVGGLVRALDDVLNPQATLCPWGRTKSLSEDQIVGRVRHVRRHERPDRFDFVEW